MTDPLDLATAAPDPQGPPRRGQPWAADAVRDCVTFGSEDRRAIAAADAAPVLC